MSAVIEFRFPEQQRPMWAWNPGEGEPYGMTFNPDNAAVFDTEEIAEQVLATSWGAENRSYGQVVAKPTEEWCDLCHCYHA